MNTESLLLVILYCFFGTLLFIAFAGQRRRVRNGISLNPGSIGGAILCYTYFFHPALMISTNTFYHSDRYSQDALTLGLVAFVMFGLFCLLGYRFSELKLRGKKWGRPSFAHLEPLQLSIVIFAFILLIVPALVSAGWLWSVIGKHGFGRYMADRIFLTAGAGYIMAPMLWPSAFVYVWAGEWTLVKKLRRGKGIIVILGTISVIASIVCGLVIGSRTQTLLPILLAYSIYLLGKGNGIIPKAAIFKYALVLSVLMIIGTILGDVRNQVMGGQSELRMSSEEISVLKGMNGYWGVSEHTYWIFENPSRLKFEYGSTFAAAFVGWVPRTIWPEKPLGGGPALVNMRNPGVYDLSRGGGLTSNTTGIVFESYMNFGWLGIGIIGTIFGAALSLFRPMAYRIRTSLDLALWVVLLYFFCSYLTEEFFGVTAKLVTVALPLVLLSKFSRLRYSLKRSATRIVL